MLSEELYNKSLSALSSVLSSTEEHEAFRRKWGCDLKLLKSIFDSKKLLEIIDESDEFYSINNMPDGLYNEFIKYVKSNKYEKALKLMKELNIDLILLSNKFIDEMKDDFDEQKLNEIKSNIRNSLKEKNHIVESNLRLVLHVVARQKCEKIVKNDLIQEGNIGLMRSVERFDWERGTRFSTYAVWWIQSSIYKYIKEKEKQIRIPTNTISKVWKISKLNESHKSEKGVPLSEDVMKKEFGIDKDTYEYVINILHNGVSSLDSPLFSKLSSESKSNFDLADILSDPDDTSQFDDLYIKQINEILMNSLSELSATEQRVIIRRFALNQSEEPMTLQEIADKYNLSGERIRQIETVALKKLYGKLRRTLKSDLTS